MYELLWYHWFYCIFKPFPDFHSRVIFHYRSLNHARRSLMPSGRHQSHVLWLSFVIQHSLMSRLGCGTMEKNSLMISDSWVRHILQEQLITNGVGRISLGFRKARIAINSTLVQVTFVIAKSSRVMKLILAVWSYLGANSVLFLKENCDHLQTDKWRTDQPWKNSNTWATHTHTHVDMLQCWRHGHSWYKCATKTIPSDNANIRTDMQCDLQTKIITNKNWESNWYDH